MMNVLIVSPHFPPTNAADMQRIRLLLPYFAEGGVDVEVLAVKPEQVAAPTDLWLEAGLPDDVPVHRVKALGLEWSKVPGLGTLSYRALGAIRRKGEEVLGKDRRPEDRDLKHEGKGQRSEVRNQKSDFDLVYFSTTQFGIHVLGPEWKRKFGVPFVMDYQDPWVNDYYREHPEITPPGGRLKYVIASWLSRHQEPKVLRECAGITSVSAAYPEQLARRYPWLRVEDLRSPPSDLRPPTSDLQPLPFTVLPFPGDERDLERVRQSDTHQTVFDPDDGLIHWVYIGRGGEDMALAVRAIFSAVSSSFRSQCSSFKLLRLHFIGTSYATAGRGVKTIEPLAAEYGLQDIVCEHPDRIPYSETLRCLLDADVLIVPGSDDPAYTASKIYPYLLADKAMLAVFHEQSSVTNLIRRVGGGTVVGFRSGEPADDIARRILADAFDENCNLKHVPLDREKFTPNTGSNQAKVLAGFFKQCLKRATR